MVKLVLSLFVGADWYDMNQAYSHAMSYSAIMEYIIAFFHNVKYAWAMRIYI